MRILITTLFVYFLIGCKETPQTIIQTDKGKIEGVFNSDKDVRIFKGIPFAAPPVGELRWKAPRPAAEWAETLKCTNFAASPIQNNPQPFYCWTEEFIAKPEPLSEDCLYLNVWTSAKEKDAKQPVFVWIYGGGLSSGSSNCAIYDGEEMAKKGVVFVSINYRVGALGFMAHPELSNESENNVSGNYGFLDQMAALKWIQNNISAFGGDSDNVTIAGQSAGAFSVNVLLASPLAKGLFHKAILQSGGLLSNRLQQNLTDSESVGVKLMETAAANSIAELRKIPAEKIQEISNSSNLGRFGVTMDDYVLPKDLMTYFKNGQQQHVPIIAGWVTGDGELMNRGEMTVEQYKEDAQALYGDRARAFLDIFPVTNDEDVKAANGKLGLINFAGLPSHLLAGFNKKSSYLYQFGHVPPDKPNFPNYGAFHTSDVPYTLHTLHLWDRDWQPLDKEIEETISSYWVNFAKTGNPNGEALPEWPEYDKESGHILTLENEIKSSPGLMKAAFDFLEEGILK